MGAPLVRPDLLTRDAPALTQFFLDRPELHLYGLADLEEPYWSASTWWRRNDAVVGLVHLPGGGGDVVYAVSSRDPSGTLALLEEVLPALPSGTLVTGPIGLGEMLDRRDAAVWHRGYHRFVLVDERAVGEPSDEVQPLGPVDAADLQSLYDRDPGSAFFRSSMLDDATFVGVRRDDRLVAAAGTHVLSPALRLAAIGAVVTDPEYRRQGLARDVTRGVIARMAGRVDVIGLNAADRNKAARRLYQDMGFEERLAYEEAEIK